MQDKTIQPSGGILQMMFMTAGIIAVAVGLVGITFGSLWSGQALEFFEGIEIVEIIGTYAPYFPFVAFLPIFLIMLGAFLIVKSRD